MADSIPPSLAVLPRLAHAVVERQQELSRASESLAAASGLACPAGCGACCASPTVESSIVDMLPAAIALFERGDAVPMHARLLASSAGAPSSRCALFEPDPLHPADEARGRCGLYAFRPSICRVFGFAARRGRSGALEVATCKLLRRVEPAAVARAQAAIDAGLDAPRIDRASAEIAREHGADERPLPINEALRLALERVGLERALGRRAAPEDDEPPSRPQRPQSPRRAA